MRRLSVWVTALALAGLAVTGCNGEDADTGSDGTQPSEPTSTGPSEPPGRGDLRSALLRLQDMPAGWSAASYDPESDDNVCPAEVAGPLGLDTEPQTVGMQYLASPMQGPSFSEAIQVVPQGRGPELMPIVEDAMAACEGQKYSGRTAHVSELGFPSAGDESAAYTITLDGIPIHAVYVVSGDIAIIMSAYDLTGGDPVDLLEEYVPLAVDKAEDVLG